MFQESVDGLSGWLPDYDDSNLRLNTRSMSQVNPMMKKQMLPVLSVIST